MSGVNSWGACAVENLQGPHKNLFEEVSMTESVEPEASSTLPTEQWRARTGLHDSGQSGEGTSGARGRAPL